MSSPGPSKLSKPRGILVPTAEIDQAIAKVENESFGTNTPCPFCGKIFTKKSSLVTHIKNHAVDKKFTCNYCKKGFTQAANLRNHERIHRNERPFVCKDCGKAFTQITNLNNHRRLHTGERPFVCLENDCGRSFAQVTNLNNHMKTHHKAQQYLCNQCPSRFAQVSQLNAHLSTHDVAGQGLTCPHCPGQAPFKQQSQLQQHMKQHGLTFPYECNQCEEKFVSIVHLDKHRNSHIEFRYKCSMCSSSFNQEGLLKKHIQRHIDGRLLTCPVDGCEEGFTVKNLLTRHMQHHHSIENCTQRISVKRLKMTSYVRTAASGKYKCYFESCDESFSAVDTLNNHLRDVHGLSIVKNAGRRSKMDLMFLEQVKMQRKQETGLVRREGSSMTATSTSTMDHYPSQQIQVQPDLFLDNSRQDGYEEEIEESDGHNSALFGCSFCFRGFQTEADLQVHTTNAHPSE